MRSHLMLTGAVVLGLTAPALAQQNNTPLGQATPNPASPTVAPSPAENPTSGDTRFGPGSRPGVEPNMTQSNPQRETNPLRQSDGNAPSTAPAPGGATQPGTTAGGPGGSGLNAGSAATRTLDPAISAMTAEKLIGTDVYDTAGKEVGEIEDIMFNTQGQVTAALVDVGGFLGIGERRVSLDLSQLRLQGDRVVLDTMTKEEVERLPAFEQAPEWTKVDRTRPLGTPAR